MIETARLVLRPARPDDLGDLHAVFSDPRAMRYWSHETHEEIARTRETLDGMIASHAETGCEYVLVRGNRVIGKAGMWRIGEVGYILHPDFWGRGLMHEAMAAVIAEAFRRHPDLGALTAEIDPRNDASARLLARLGFHHTHSTKNTIEVWGEWCDSAFWRLDRPGRAKALRSGLD